MSGHGVWPGIDSVNEHGAKTFKSTQMRTLCPGMHYIVWVSSHSVKKMGLLIPLKVKTKGMSLDLNCVYCET